MGRLSSCSLSESLYALRALARDSRPALKRAGGGSGMAFGRDMSVSRPREKERRARWVVISESQVIVRERMCEVLSYIFKRVS